MSRSTILVAVMAATLVPLELTAQDPAEALTVDPASAVIYAAYLECDPAREARADQLFDETFASVLDKQLEQLHISAWGWSVHNTGGRWRRLVYYVAPNLSTLLDVRAVLSGDFQREHPIEAREFSEICPTHEDYFWTQVASSTDRIAQDRPAAGLSAYYRCDAGREARADELVRTALAPIFDRHVASGDLASWGWYAHLIGGEYRRLAVFDGANHHDLLRAWRTMVTEIQTELPEEATEFSSICGTHEDYMWDIAIARP